MAIVVIGGLVAISVFMIRAAVALPGSVHQRTSGEKTVGVLVCAFPMVTLLAIPKEFVVGRTLSWYVVPRLGCGLLAAMNP